MPENGCLFCTHLAAEEQALTVFDGAYWRVLHLWPVSYLGWFAVVLKRHSEALHDLTVNEWFEHAEILAWFVPLMQRCLACEKEYVASFHEQRGNNHVHVHVIGKPAQLPGPLTGSRIFSTLGKVTERDTVPKEHVAILCERMRMLHQTPY